MVLHIASTITSRKADEVVVVVTMHALLFSGSLQIVQLKEPKYLHDREVIDFRKYLENTTVCRRKWLLDFFDPGCATPGDDKLLCCDICANSINIDT